MSKDNQDYEDYLDQLLNQAQGLSTPQKKKNRENSSIESEQSGSYSDVEIHNTGRRRREGGRRNTADDDFLNSFEQELNDFESQRFLDDFELEMDADLSGARKESKEIDLSDFDDTASEYRPRPEQPETKPSMDENSFFEGLGEAMNGPAPNYEREEVTPSFEETPSAESVPSFDSAPSGDAESVLDLLSGLGEDLNFGEDSSAPAESADTVAAEVTPSETDASEAGAPDVDALQEAVSEAPSMDAEEVEKALATAKEAENDAPAAGNAEPSDDDLLAMLGSLGDGDSDLADIGSMLQADEAGESIQSDVAEDLSSLGFEVSPQDAEELSQLENLSEEDKRKEEEPGKKKMGKKSKKKDKEASGDSGEKQGFLAKLKNLFFGPDEEENEGAGNAAADTTTGLEGIDASDENLAILAALEGGSAAAPADSELDEKAKKKAEKEAKKQAKKEAKEAKKKEKEEAKKAKKAEKAAKPKKEKKPKKPKVKDNTPPLPKLPVFLILLMCASFFGAVFFAGRGINYIQSVKEAKNSYEMGDYVDAYEELSDVELKEKDLTLYSKTEILAGMQSLLVSYETLDTAGRDELALDCLIRVIGHYDANLEKADELGITAEVTDFEGKAEELLKDNYNVSYDEALRIYFLRSRTKYSMELSKILMQLGKAK